MPEAALRVVIATAPRGTALETEIQLLKPALIYGDLIKLYSPTTTMYQGMAALAEADPETRVQILADLIPSIDPQGAPELLTTLGQFQLLRRKKYRSPQEINAMVRLEKAIDAAWREISERVEMQLSAAGVEELAPAMEAGLLEIEELVSTGDVDQFLEEMLQTFVAKLADVLARGEAYPLFDEQTGLLVSAGVSEGLFVPSIAAEDRAKQLGLAAGFMGYLPAFPHASVSEILEIRHELREPLVRFRAAMVEMGHLARSQAYEAGFSAEVEQLYRAKVAPALQDLHEGIRANRYLRQLVGAVMDDMKAFLIQGALALAVTPLSAVPALATAAIHVVTPAIQAAYRQRVKSDQIRKEQLYLLYRTEELIGN